MIIGLLVQKNFCIIKKNTLPCLPHKAIDLRPLFYEQPHFEDCWIEPLLIPGPHDQEQVGLRLSLLYLNNKKQT